ncbi:response regulator transcription factor [Flavihumibacter petaseus]|uniref:Putative two-component response regulator n=1 Tax=Flavihumibacter petaseus NBRC 106054 TaxID=1220578 RepID=A0A0E9N6D5_9BACT|nr:response regulator transcription factor [Flavihumibacter petaseus]GAO45286.1 putative two-component response regulator [Flavihumibacter petaseus NBRC 106054]
MRRFNVVLVEDHTLLRKGLVSLVERFEEYKVVLEVSNGKELSEKLDPACLPDLILMDINMPEMDGYSTTSWVKRTYPDIKVLALSMYDTENAIIRMFKAGARGYIMKYCDPGDLRFAMDSVTKKGYYYSETVTGRLIHTINQYEDLESLDQINPLSVLNDRELEFLRFACTEMTYKEIASRMYLSPRTIDGYRDALFDKLRLKTRVGLVTFAIRNGIVSI